MIEDLAECYYITTETLVEYTVLRRFRRGVVAAVVSGVRSRRALSIIEECFQIRIRLGANVQFHEDPCVGSFF